MHTKRMLAGALTSVSLAAAGLGLATGTALAEQPGEHTWCPGMSMLRPQGPGPSYRWDMNVCHTWFLVDPGVGNVPHEMPVGPLDPVTYRWTNYEFTLDGSSVWDGPNPPEGTVKIFCGNDMFTGIPIPC